MSCAHRVAAGMHVTAGGFWCLMHSNTCCCWYAGAATTRFRVVCGLFWRVIYRRSLYNIDFIRRPCDRGLQEADVSRRVISSESTDGSPFVFAGTAGSVLDGCRGVDRMMLPPPRTLHFGGKHAFCRRVARSVLRRLPSVGSRTRARACWGARPLSKAWGGAACPCAPAQAATGHAAVNVVQQIDT